MIQKGEHMSKIVLEQPNYRTAPGEEYCRADGGVWDIWKVPWECPCLLKDMDQCYVLSRTVVGTYYRFRRLIKYFIKKYYRHPPLSNPRLYFVSYFLQEASREGALSDGSLFPFSSMNYSKFYKDIRDDGGSGRYQKERRD